jgi:hypothetical protein
MMDILGRCVVVCNVRECTGVDGKNEVEGNKRRTRGD